MQNKAKENIINLINNTGPIPFAKFMHEALYNPQYGYYMQESMQIGASGDFTTAPEISPMFGACIARQIDEYIENEGGEIEILELGPGNGSLAHSLLSNLKNITTLKKYKLLELSPRLKIRQAEKNTKFKEKIEHISSLPQNFSGIIIANEVLDAMPVHKFIIADNLLEPHVSYDKQEICYLNMPSQNQDLIQQVMAINTLLPPGYKSEINLALPSWIRSIANCLNKGLVLLVDYGYSQKEYYHIERQGGTLKCFYKMTAHNNPLQNIGQQDITSHVDFTTAAKAARDSELNIIGYAEQAHFLMNLGLISLAEESYQQDPLSTAKEIKLLTMPSEMGSLCKVLGLAKNIQQTELTGFHNYNKVESLFN